MDKQFKITAYHSTRDMERGINGKTYTDIETLLRGLNERLYYKAEGGSSPVPCTDDWDYSYNEMFEGYEGKVACWDIEELPTDRSIRIVGVDYFYALPQRTGVNIYDSLEDPRLADIDRQRMTLYPYSMEEFLKTIARGNETDRYGRPKASNLDLSYDYIALLNS